MQESGLEVKVYVDLLFGVNLAMDFLILWAAGKLSGSTIRFLRLLVGALLGAGYSLVIFLPVPGMWTSIFAKIACSFIMVLVSYAPLSLRGFARAIVFFYLISFAMGGAVTAATLMADQTPAYLQAWKQGGMSRDDFHYGWLIFGVITAFVFGYGGVLFIRKNWLKQNLLNDLTILLPGQKLCVRALLDTGNQLTDPVSQNPVIVVQAGIMQKHLPENILRAIESEEEETILHEISGLDREWAARVRMIPFNSVDKAHRLMVGFRPDGVELRNKKQVTRKADVVIGLVKRTLSSEGQYQALLHPDIFHED